MSDNQRSDEDVEWLRKTSNRVYFDGAYGEYVILTLEDSAKLNAIANRLETSVPLTVAAKAIDELLIAANEKQKVPIPKPKCKCTRCEALREFEAYRKPALITAQPGRE